MEGALFSLVILEPPMNALSKPTVASDNDSRCKDLNGGSNLLELDTKAKLELVLLLLQWDRNYGLGSE